MFRLLVSAALVAAVAGHLPAQGPPATLDGVVAPRASTATTGSVVRARPGMAPVVDGRDNDAIWREAPPMDQFRQFNPVEDGDPTFRTEVRAAYDDRYVYVVVRAFDPHPDSILSLLSRRDVRTNSDQIKIMFDGYRDRRTGIEPGTRRHRRDLAVRTCLQAPGYRRLPCGRCAQGALAPPDPMTRRVAMAAAPHRQAEGEGLAECRRRFDATQCLGGSTGGVA